MELLTLLQYCVLGAFLVVVAYAVVRAAAFAYFRSKMEFLRRRHKFMQEKQ